MKVVEFTGRETSAFPCFSTCHPAFGGQWANGYEDHPLGVEVGRLAGVDDLAVLVDVNRENSVRPAATYYAAASECRWYDVRIARIAIQLDSGTSKSPGIQKPSNSLLAVFRKSGRM